MSRTILFFVGVILILPVPISADISGGPSPVAERNETVIQYSQGTLAGPIIDMCGEFYIIPDEGFEEKWIHVACSINEWADWSALSGSHIQVWGEDFWLDVCGIAGMGGWVFCVVDLEVPTESLTWSFVKLAY